MSRLELDNIQSQLKVAIQSHQILVSKIKLSPQDMGLKKQLHNLQKEIMLMSEKQKIIVQKLRRDIMERKNVLTTTVSTTQQSHQVCHASAVFTPQSLLASCQPTDLSKTFTYTTQHTDISKENHQSLQPTDLSMKSTHTHQPTDLTKIPTPTCSRTDLSIATLAEPTSVDTETANTFTPISKASVPVSPVSCSPLRVPQYQANRPALLPIQGSKIPQHVTAPKNEESKPDLPKSAPTKENRCGPFGDAPMSIDEKCDGHELRKKLEFMASVELISRDSIREMVGRRTERKRRSTCNPNFAYGFELERRPRMSSFLASALLCAKRSKSKPKPDASSTCVSPDTPGSPESKPFLQQNGLSNSIVHNSCMVCGMSGHFLHCDTCSHVYHPQCLDPPISTVPERVWTCPKCQEATQRTAMSLAEVNSYIANKAGKEDEKRKLLKRSTELLHEKCQLESRSKQLNEILAHQGIRKQELLDINRKAHQSVENLKQFVKAVQSS